MLSNKCISPELPRYFGSVNYWLRRAAGTPVAQDALFDKRRKEIHRFTVADVNGPLTLTLPIVKPHGKAYACWRDVRISTHGQWWHVHRTALESAYGRTPFFEFYIDRFLEFLSPQAVERYQSVIDFNEAIDKHIEEILLLQETPVIPPERPMQASTGVPRPLLPISSSPTGLGTLPPYWQPRQEHFGFIPDLSVLDLIFCLGPEAAIYIRSCSRSE